jgi:hypothetical protein
MVTAARFGLPEEIIRRADELEKYLPHEDRPSLVPPSMNSIDNEVDGSNEEPADPMTSNTSMTNTKQFQNEFQQALQMAEQVTSQPFTTIPPNAIPPPALAKQSCVYLLQLRSNPPRYYVGETDAFFQRLKRHRSKGEGWSKCRAAVLPVASKTEARRYESLLIQELSQAGYSMESIRDGTTTR